MRISDLSLPRLFLLLCCLFLIPLAAWPQAASPQSRIVERVNDSALVTLRGNTHPLAQPQFDQGAAPPDLPMARMLLVLRRSDAQEAALEKLLDDQQDRNSTSYHQWLTPDQFGQQFGPSDQDVQTVAAWLRSHGFQIGGISLGHALIEFSGTAAQVQQAFHAEIHRYVVNGEEHWANASDPQIPTALAPVVEGLNSLHNFPKKPMYRFAGKVSRGGSNAGAQVLGAEFTTPDSQCAISGNCYFVGPYDFATIYNVLPLWNGTPAIDGTGQSIAIVNESNINIQDVRDFRNIFGLPANDPQVILNGPDPGLVQGIESEADIDVEWSGAVAKGATIKLVVSASTSATDGVDLSAVYAIENSVAPIISESFGECELFLGNGGNSFQNAIRQQAAAQGITFINSSGDEGSARCDPFSGNAPDPATHGLAVSGLASSPNDVAVGGTDFQNFGPNFTLGVASPYWRLTNDPQQASALGYIPETTWNSTCTNNAFVILKAGANAEASCNNSNLSNFVETLGGGGGKSQCTSSNGPNPANCTGGYAKPSWQAAPGVPADGVRDIPDVSLYASNGFMDSSYILCESDRLPSPQPCSLNSPFGTFLGVGGTSVSAPAFAGIVALVNQFTGSSGQGNANYVLYKVASSSAQTSHACGASSSPSAGCIFYDVTSGTIAVPCDKGSPNCTTASGSDLYGVLNGYNATAGYDLATGLGSVNAFNLVHNWIQPTASSTTTLSLNGGKSVSITHGQSISFDITVAPGAATGFVSLEGSPTGSTALPVASFPLQNGSASGATTNLAGGNSYAVKAHYSGDGTYKPSDSAPVTVTVAPEASKTIITVPTLDPNTGRETGNTPTTVAYGTPLDVRVDVGNAQASQTFPERLVCAPLSCATGAITITDSVNGSAPATLSPAGGFALNTGGFAEDDPVSLFSGGMHLLTASYPGDNSFNASSNTYAFTVIPGATRIIPFNPPLPPFVATPFSLGVILTMNFFGAMPSCDFTFYDGTTTMQGTPNCGWQANGPFLYVTLPVSQATAGSHTYSAKFNGDPSHVSSVSAPMTTQVFYGTATTLSADSTNVQYGTSITLTSLVDSTLSKGPAIPNTVAFYYNNSPILGTVSYAPTTDSSGNLALRASISFVPQFSSFAAALFNGDSNYFQSGSTTLDVNVNIPDFSLSGSVPTSPITAGSSAMVAITVTPASNASSPVTLACPPPYGLPAGISCSFSPSTVNLSNGTAVTSSLLISTLAPSSSTTISSVPLLHPPFVTPRFLQPFPMVFLIALLLFLLLPSRLCRNYAAFSALRAFCLFLFLGFVGCGSGSAGGGGGDGGGGSVPTSITLTASSVKVAYSSISGGTVNLTANISSSKPAEGTVTFTVDESNGFSVTSQAVGGVAQFQLANLSVGIHTLTAQYSGDASTLSSQTKGSLNIAVTGQTGVTVQAKTGGLSHLIGVTFNLQ
jgi:hypothetical protein